VRIVRPLAIAALLLFTLSSRAAAQPEVHGRVFARQTVSKVEVTDDIATPWLWTQEVASGRLSVEYRHKKTLKTSVEVEFSNGDATMKDVYVRWRPMRELTLQVGRFKKPISAVQLEGLWRLPVAERGLLSDLEFSGVTLPLGGRGDGIQLAFDPKQLPFEVTLAVFQPDLLVSIDATEELAADVYARVEFDVTDDVAWGVTLGAASYLEKPDKGQGFRHAPVSGTDLTISTRGFRLWADVIIGLDTLPFALDVATIDLPCDTEDMSCPPIEFIADRGVFLATRAIASYRVKKVEPFVTVSLIDLNMKFKNDEARQYGVGVASKINKRLRWQLQLDRTTAADDAPVGDTTRAMLQLGAAF
jgi:hypothetical protein